MCFCSVGPVSIFVRFVFNTNNTVPSEREVLAQGNAFLSAEEEQLNNTVRVQNLTFEKITENSFALTLGYEMKDVSFPENIELRNETQELIQDSVNTLLNELLSQPVANPFTFPQGTYTNLPNEIQVNEEYVYQERDIEQPSNFLSAILRVIVSIFLRLVFNTNNTVPSESEILTQGNAFLSAEEEQLNNTVRVQNLTFEKITENSFALTLGYEMKDVSFPENIELRNKTQELIQDSVNTLLNELLSQPVANPFTFPQGTYTMGPVSIFVRLVFNTNNTVPSESEILAQGNAFLSAEEEQLNNTVRVQNLTFEKITENSFALTLGYEMKDVSFPENIELRNKTQELIQDSVNTLLNELLSQPVANPFTFPQGTYTNLPNEIQVNEEYVYQESDIEQPSNFLSAILRVIVSIFVRLVFNTNNTVPSESEILAQGNAFLSAEEEQLNNTVRVQNLTFEKITENSFALTLGYEIKDVSFPENVELRNQTQELIQDSVNTLLNELLSQPVANPFTFPQGTYTNLPNEIQVNEEYVYQENDIEQPSNFLSAILRVIVSIFLRLVFNTNNTVPSESEILTQGNAFLSAEEEQLNNTVRVQNLTFEKITENSFALTLGYEMKDVSFPENIELRNKTQELIQDSVNTLLNELLSQPVANPFTFPQGTYTNLPNEIQVNEEYVYQESDIEQPSNFLSAILRVIVSIFVRLVFNTNNTVPSESEILAQGNAFLSAEEEQLNNTVRVQNLTFEKITENSFALTLGYEIKDVSFPENVELRNQTQELIQDLVNTLLNELLSQPVANPFTFPQGTYTNLPNEIQVNEEYVYQENDIEQPSNFLSAILRVIVSIFVRLVFNTNNTVPSESEILTQGNAFLSAEEEQLNNTVRVQNLTFEKITENSFALTLGYEMKDVSFPENIELRNKTQELIQDSVNTLLNELLSQPVANPFTFPQGTYTNLPNEIQVNEEYVYQESDIEQPSNFLSAILRVIDRATTTAAPVTVGPISTAPSTTSAVTATSQPATAIVPPIVVLPTFSGTVTPTAAPRTIMGPVSIFVRLVFNTNNTVPSESEILAQGNAFLSAEEEQLNNTVRVQNLTFEKITENSFALTLGYEIKDVSFPENVELRNQTQELIQDLVNTLLNELLSQPVANPFTFPQGTYTNLPNEIQVNEEYVYQESDIEQPSNFLSAILRVIATSQPATAIVPPIIVLPTFSGTVTPTAAPRTIVGSVSIFVRFVFHTIQPVPSESAVLSQANAFLSRQTRALDAPVQRQDLTYEKLTNNSFALALSYEIANVTFPENFELRNGTRDLIQGSINSLLNGLLAQPNANPFTFPQGNYTNLSDEIHANLDYVFREGDINQPSAFLSAILRVSGLAPTTTAPTLSGTVTTAASPSTIVGFVSIFVRFVFHTIQPVPSESEVLSQANAFLSRRPRALDTPVRVQDLTYEKLTSNSFALGLSYVINNVSFPENFELRNGTRDLIQGSINSLLNGLLGQPNANHFTFPQGNYTNLANEIRANLDYVFREGDINQPSGFLSAILTVSGMAPTTTSSPVLLLITTSSVGRFPGWALAIIIPCGIAIILLPFWILLCCLLCGCCAAIKRRWRRRAYHLQPYVVHPV
ncbi:hypothetical protein SKAU_G00395260 [Synaphobranchus kaupii]|uniref:Uncharacterized protein n=1 Tax=Synaphobranchus kaupii TaxID=118154 RepID=A0A9Q1ECB7_SYNKA|nr:hypothetical protein SKAU_G00395260 [Synaphobranchus kaupii]